MSNIIQHIVVKCTRILNGKLLQTHLTHEINKQFTGNNNNKKKPASQPTNKHDPFKMQHQHFSRYSHNNLKTTAT